MYQILVFSHFIYSVQKIPILPLTDSKITILTQPKTTSFWSLLIFFFFLKKDETRKKEEENQGQPHSWSGGG
jgi:hypothetical protein